MTKTYDIPELIAHVQAKAAKDAAFRDAFLKDPQATVELEFGFTMPEPAKVAAVQAPKDTVVVVLPYIIPPSTNGELSDSELEGVAGGSKQGAHDFFNGLGGAILSGVGGAVTAGVGEAACAIAKAAS